MPTRLTLTTSLIASAFAAVSSAAATNGFKYSFPALSGPHCVGKTPPIVLTDHSRNDPFSNDTSDPREVIVQVYYPAAKPQYGQCGAGDAYATPGFAGWVSTFLGGNVSADYFQSFRTNSVTNAPYHHDDNTKLLLYSHGLGVPRKLNQAVIEDVASHGYVVALMEHPHDSGYAEFPDGRVIGETDLLAKNVIGYNPQASLDVEVRANDTLFTLESLRKGDVKVPGCDISKLARKVGMFGHSLGGELSLVVMLRTPDVVAGTNMDGWFWNAANATNLTHPADADCHRPYLNIRSDPTLLPDFLLVAGGGPQNQVDAMKVQTGPKVQPIVKNSEHYSFTDLNVLSIPALDAGKSMEKELAAFRAYIGTVDPRRMHKITTKYHTWFFDNTIKGGKADISKGLPGFPEVTLGDIKNVKDEV